MTRIVVSSEERVKIGIRDPITNDYQSEKDLAEELLRILIGQGYEYKPDIKDETTLKSNLQNQLERLNSYRHSDFVFSPNE